MSLNRWLVAPLSLVLYRAAWFVQCLLLCHVLAVIDTSIQRLSVWLIWSDSRRRPRVRILNPISHTSEKLAASGATENPFNRRVQLKSSLRSYVWAGWRKQTNKQTNTASCSGLKPPLAKQRKRTVENKGGEPDSVSTATLIDILQVEQLSSGLTTAS